MRSDRELRLSTVLGRAARLVCPSCGKTKISESYLKVHRACNVCGLVFEPEAGFFVGAIYFNVAVTYFLILGVFLTSLAFSWSISDVTFLTMIVIAAAVPLCFFQWSRSFWLALNFLVLKPDRTTSPR